MNQAQKTLVTKARSVGSSELAVPLTDEACCYLVAVIVKDLGLDRDFPECPESLPPFFGSAPLEKLVLPGVDFWKLIERLLKANPDADTYFSCLATLHKYRLKYARILERQAIPTMDQVGPRGLLQYGAMSARALTGFLFWRKWIFDIDNRAGQETGYLFEPIIAHAIGGAPASARKSPVRRQRDSKKGRQVDCLREKLAYEIKLRVTIAASGQGRWQEELEFPEDAKASGFRPVLIIFDPTPNEKLDSLKKAFLKAKGAVYVAEDAWKHLDEAAGPTMATFIERYVREPIQALLAETPSEGLPDLTLKMSATKLTVSVGDESWSSPRAPLSEQDEVDDSDDSEQAEDADDE
jgi:hypothetical protein